MKQCYQVVGLTNSLSVTQFTTQNRIVIKVLTRENKIIKQNVSAHTNDINIIIQTQHMYLNVFVLYLLVLLKLNITRRMNNYYSGSENI